MPITVSAAAPIIMPQAVATAIRQNYFSVPGTSKYGAVPIGGRDVRFVASPQQVFDASVANPMTSDGDQYAEGAYSYLAPYVSVDSRTAWHTTYKAFTTARAANTNVSGAWSAFIGAHENFVRNASIAQVERPADTGAGPAATPQGNPPTGGAVAPASGGGSQLPSTPVPGNNASPSDVIPKPVLYGAIGLGVVLVGAVVYKVTR